MRYDLVLILDALADPVAALADARHGLAREGVVLVVNATGAERQLRETAVAAGFTRVRRLDGVLLELRR